MDNGANAEAELSFKELLGKVKELPPERKAKLLEEVLGVPGVTVIFGNNLTTSEILVQIHSMEKPDLGLIIKAIANRMERS